MTGRCLIAAYVCVCGCVSVHTHSNLCLCLSADYDKYATLHWLRFPAAIWGKEQKQEKNEEENQEEEKPVAHCDPKVDPEKRLL